jgi:2-polyprenyl-3-methyl-5-hydroxy-6-metoxy-1,4-benzoquinol methylase
MTDEGHEGVSSRMKEVFPDENNKYTVVEDPVYGYRRLDPIPDETEVKEFYQSKYYDLIRKGGRASELRRIMAGGEEAEKELAWLRSTLYADIQAILERQSLNSRRLLDIGCGTGDLIASMGENGWKAAGLDLSSESVEFARKRGLEVYDLSVEDFMEKHQPPAFDAVTLLNILEHVPNPVALLNLIKRLLADGGIVVIRVPNDFTELQINAQEHLKKQGWWIAVPDHINYFNFESLGTLLERLGFEVVYSQGDFPMEIFLLMGDDYAGDPIMGNRCHQKRVSFEMAVDGDLRRRMYRALSGVGVGRNCLMFARLRGK